MLGLCCDLKPSLVVVHWLLMLATSLVTQHGLWGSGSAVGVCGLSCSATCGIFPDQESNPRPPALTGGFLTTGPPGKSYWVLFNFSRIDVPICPLTNNVWVPIFLRLVSWCGQTFFLTLIKWHFALYMSLVFLCQSLMLVIVDLQGLGSCYKSCGEAER